MLHANAGKSYQGSIVLGKGFVLTPEEREALISRDTRNAERIFPYLGGEELNTSPKQTPHRYVIDFGDMTLEQAERWPELIAILRERVKPERDKLKDNADGRRRKKQWWIFGRQTPSLYAAIAPLKHCLATARVTKHLNFSFLPTGQVLSDKVVVMPDDRVAAFGLLQSRIHGFWAWLLSSTMRSDLNYTPTDCFETFPFPPAPTLAPTAPLEAIAAELYSTRAAFMLATDQGLTKTYNALKDPADSTPEILHLRQLHEALDRAVLDAYDQPQIAVPPYCNATPAALEQFEDEVLDFLFERNELLAKAEARATKRAKS